MRNPFVLRKALGWAACHRVIIRLIALARLTKHSTTLLICSLNWRKRLSGRIPVVYAVGLVVKPLCSGWLPAT